ncbi:hypothetical protein EG329_001757 [Mollisiaceae sp. DMI_Dod_QoI]|nr:hypothetical protein EG329_001757 [Helotiales sp. DMI_Dod_QoI]
MVDKLRRTVFYAEAQVDQKPDSWISDGVLEVAIFPGYQNHSATNVQKVILYRQPKGTILDITSLATIQELQAKAPGLSFSLKKDIDASGESTGFEINLVHLADQTQLTDPPAYFDGNISHRLKDGDSVQKRSWRGDARSTRDDDLAVIIAGEQPLPEDVKSFLDLMPLKFESKSIADEALESEITIFKELMHKALPDRAKEFFFKNYNTKNLNSTEDCLGVTKTSDGGTNSRQLLKLDSIFADNENLFKVAAMHILCKELSNAGWLRKEYRDCVQDKVAAFFEVLRAPNVSNEKRQYFFNLDVGELRKQYDNATKRIYYSAYFAMRPAWAGYLGSPTTLFDNVKTQTATSNYREHWLPKQVNISENKSANEGSVPLNARLALLADKLTLLKLIASGGIFTSQKYNDIDTIITDLATFAKQAGLVRSTSTDPKAEVGASWNILRDEIQLFTAAEQASWGVATVSMGDLPDPQSYNTHEFLLKEAAPLALYTWKPSGIIKDIVDAASDVVKIVISRGA